MDEDKSKRLETVRCKLCGRKITYEADRCPPAVVKCPHCGYKMNAEDLRRLV